MSDKMTIVGADNKAKYKIIDNEVYDMNEHKHDFDELEICIICNKSKISLIEEIANE